VSPVSPEGRRLLFAGLSVVGYALSAEALLLHGILGSGGAGGGDVFAYWTSGRHVLDGEPLYGPGVGGYAAFLYPPPLAQLFAILAWLPFPVVVWGWRIVELVCVRIAVGSWRRVGIALLVWPPIIAELDAGNVHLLVAAAVAMVIRGDSRFLVPAALTKFASLAALPASLRRDPGGLARGVVIARGYRPGLLHAVAGSLVPVRDLPAVRIRHRFWLVQPRGLRAPVAAVCCRSCARARSRPMGPTLTHRGDARVPGPLVSRAECSRGDRGPRQGLGRRPC